MTAHIVLPHDLSEHQEYDVKANLREVLSRLNITHLTIETERTGLSCDEVECEKEDENKLV